MKEEAQDYIIQADAVSFRYEDGTLALEGLSLGIRSGAFAFLIGRNGSGKTTLLHHFCRLLTPLRGTVYFRGVPMSTLPERDVYRAIGLVFQDPNDQLFCATVREDVAFGPRNLGLPAPEVEDRVLWSLERAGVADLAGRPVSRLSFGQKRRVAIAGVIAMRPDVLLLDEPTAGLDAEGCDGMMRLLHELNEEGMTIIMATQDVDLAAEHAGEIFILDRGRLVRQGRPGELLQDADALKAAGLGQPCVTRLFASLHRDERIGNPPYPVRLDEARQAVVCLIRRCPGGRGGVSCPAEVPVPDALIRGSGGAWEPGVVYVVGVGPGHRDYVTPVARRLAIAADVLVGGRRLLDLFDDFRGEKVVVTRDLDWLVPFLEERRDKRVAVVVSGDPGVYSLLGYLRRHLDPDRIRVVPGISSVQLAFARAGLPWQDARIISFHGRIGGRGLLAAGCSEDLAKAREFLIEACRENPVVAALTGPAFPAEVMARCLWEAGLGAKHMVVADSLCLPEERVVSGSPEEIARCKGLGNAVAVITDGR